MRRYDSYKDSGVAWIGEIPEHWEIRSLRNFLSYVSIKGHGDKQLLSVTRENGVIVRNVESKEENHNFVPDDLSGYKLVEEGQFVINKMKSWQGSYGVSSYTGIVSPAYYVCNLRFENKRFFNIAIRSKSYVPFFTVLCYMLGEKTEWLDVQEFEERFNSDTRVKQFKFTWSKIEDVFLYISKKVNPDAEPVVKDGKLVPDPALRDTEQVPLLYQGGIEEFMRNEVLPYAPDAFVNDDATVIGYELSFTKYFYKPIELRALKDIREEIREIESRTDGLLNEILGE